MSYFLVAVFVTQYLCVLYISNKYVYSYDSGILHFGKKGKEAEKSVKEVAFQMKIQILVFYSITV